MKKVIKIAAVAGALLAANATTVSTVAASSNKHAPKLTHVVNVQNNQVENPLLRGAKKLYHGDVSGAGSTDPWYPNPTSDGKIRHGWW